MKRLYVLLFGLFFSSALFSQGNGSVSSPFLLSTVTDLENLANAVNSNGSFRGVASNKGFSGKHFRLTNDITQAFTKTIGLNSQSYRFKGYFHGAGYTVKMLLNKPTSSYIAFIGVLDAVGVVDSLTVEGSVVGGDYVGGICGLSYGLIQDCHNKATITSGGIEGALGGVCGSATTGSMLVRLRNSGAVTSDFVAGGIVGILSTQLTVAINTAPVKSVGSNTIAGGLVGMFSDRARATVSYGLNVGIVESPGYAGGIVGVNVNGLIAHCMNSGYITGEQRSAGRGGLGGICGGGLNSRMRNCLQVGSVFPPEGDFTMVGALMGSFLENDTIWNSVYDQQMWMGSVATQSVGFQATEVGSNAHYLSGVEGKKTVDLMLANAQVLPDSAWFFSAEAYPYPKVLKDYLGRELSTLPLLLHTDDRAHGVVENFKLPSNAQVQWSATPASRVRLEASDAVLLAKGLVSIVATLDGLSRYYLLQIAYEALPERGSEKNPLVVRTRLDMEILGQAIDRDSLYYGVPSQGGFRGMHFLLMNDIVDSLRSGVGTSGGAHSFRGFFHGNGKKILLALDRPTSDSVALFASLGAEAVVDSLVLGGYVRGRSRVAALAACHEGTIRHCVNLATIEGWREVGGLSAWNKGWITQSFNRGAVTATSSVVGGLTAKNDHQLREVFNAAPVKGADSVGGICGLHSQGNIFQAYNADSVVATGDEVGGICGRSGDSITGVYNRAPVRGRSRVGAIAGFGTGRSLAYYDSLRCVYPAFGQGSGSAISLGLTSWAMSGTQALLEMDRLLAASWTVSDNNANEYYYPQLAVFATSGDTLVRSLSRESVRYRHSRDSFLLGDLLVIAYPWAIRYDHPVLSLLGDSVWVEMQMGKTSSIQNTLVLPGLTPVYLAMDSVVLDAAVGSRVPLDIGQGQCELVVSGHCRLTSPEVLPAIDAREGSMLSLGGGGTLQVYGLQAPAISVMGRLRIASSLQLIAATHGSLPALRSPSFGEVEAFLLSASLKHAGAAATSYAVHDALGASLTPPLAFDLDRAHRSFVLSLPQAGVYRLNRSSQHLRHRASVRGWFEVSRAGLALFEEAEALPAMLVDAARGRKIDQTYDFPSLAVVFSEPVDIEYISVQITDGWQDGDSLVLAPAAGFDLSGDQPARRRVSVAPGKTADKIQDYLRQNLSVRLPVDHELRLRIALHKRGVESPHHPEVFFHEANGHYYAYVSSPGLSWTAARLAAADSSYFGRKGYLASLSSAQENDFVARILKAQGWIGASSAKEELDRLFPGKYSQQGLPYDLSYADLQMAQGKYHWVCGPESGRLFWYQTDLRPNHRWYAVAGSPLAGAFSAWEKESPLAQAPLREPNDYYGKGEYFVHLQPNSGEWCDYADTQYVQGFVIEYGGLPNDLPVDVSEGMCATSVSLVPLALPSTDFEAAAQSDLPLLPELVSSPYHLPLRGAQGAVLQWTVRGDELNVFRGDSLVHAGSATAKVLLRCRASYLSASAERDYVVYLQPNILPEPTWTLPKADDRHHLSNVYADAGGQRWELTPPFHKDIREYSLLVPARFASVNIQTTLLGDGEVVGKGDVLLGSSDTLHTLTYTYGGQSQSYRINLIKSYLPITFSYRHTDDNSLSFEEVEGGRGHYSYSLDNGRSWQASATFAGLGKGSYVLRVKDGEGRLSQSRALTLQGREGAGRELLPFAVVPSAVDTLACVSFSYKDSLYAVSTTLKDTSFYDPGRTAGMLIKTLSLRVVTATKDTLRLDSCQTVTYQGISYTHDSVWNDTLVGSSGCDSVVRTLVVKVRARSYQAFSDTLTYGERYQGHGFDFDTRLLQATTTDTLLRFVGSAANGCDSLVEIRLHLRKQLPFVSPLQYVRFCPNDSVVWGGQTLRAAGDYVKNIVRSDLYADSVYRLRISINPLFSFNDTIRICADDLPCTYAGVNFYKDTDTLFRFKTQDGCDSLLYLLVSVQPYTVLPDRIFVACDSFAFEGKVYRSGTEWLDTLRGTTSCDQIRKTVVKILSSSRSETTLTACNAIYYKNKLYTRDTVIVERYTNSLGCDSLHSVHLRLLRTTAGSLELSACGQVTHRGKTYFSDTLFVEKLVNSAGCDSNLSVKIRVLPSSKTELSFRSCDSISWGGRWYTHDTIVEQRLTNSYGCDSLLRVQLRVGQSVKTYDSVAACPQALPLLYAGLRLVQDLDTLLRFARLDGCDSLVYLHFRVSPIQRFPDTLLRACESLTYKGHTYTSSQWFMDTLPALSPDECLTLRKVIVKVSPKAMATVERSACDTLVFLGKHFVKDTQHLFTLTTAAGCDSLLTLKGRVYRSSRESQRLQACQVLRYKGQEYRRDTSFVERYLTSQGCDSLRTIQIQVFPLRLDTLEHSLCEKSLPFVYGGRSFYSDIDTLFTFTDRHLCDSLVFLRLRVEELDRLPFMSLVGCDSVVYHDKVYRSSTRFEEVIHNVSPGECGTAQEIRIKVNRPSSGSVLLTGCSSLRYRGQTFVRDTLFQDGLLNAAGCDSSLAVMIYVSSPSMEHRLLDSCSRVSYRGQEYFSDASVVQHYYNRWGCDSLIQVDIRVRKPSEEMSYDSIYRHRLPYTRNGFWAHPTQDTLLKQYLINAQGCDSLAILYLHILDSIWVKSGDLFLTTLYHNSVLTVANRGQEIDLQSCRFAWQRADLLLPDSKQYISLHGQSGHYKVRVTIPDRGEITLDTVLQLSSTSRLYPNPSQAQQLVRLETASKDPRIEVYTASGQRLEAIDLRRKGYYTEIVAELPAGMYVIKIYENDVLIDVLKWLVR